MSILETECPPAFRALCERLDGARIRLRVDGKALSPAFGPEGFALVPPCESPEVDLASDRQTILEVLAGDLRLEDAVWDERLALFGSLDALARFHDGFASCVNGAVRCPSFPRLLERYRRAGAPGAGGTR